jgi:hypothetical protein
MFGWIILFALIVIAGAVQMIAGHTATDAGKLASALFAVLFLMAVVARARRGRAW